MQIISGHCFILLRPKCGPVQGAEVEFLARNKENRKDKVAVPAAPIKFYNVLEDEQVLLGESNTNKQGIAELVLSADQEYMQMKRDTSPSGPF
jgi:hypothetical protein